MRNSNWELKSLSTSLAGWAELRHDVILYGKHSSAQCGDGSEWVPDPLKSFVEPNVDFFKRLYDLVTSTHSGFEEKELLNGKIEDKFKRFSELLNFLIRVSEKELTGELLSRREYGQIEIIGSLLEDFTISGVFLIQSVRIVKIARFVIPDLIRNPVFTMTFWIPAFAGTTKFGRFSYSRTDGIIRIPPEPRGDGEVLIVDKSIENVLNDNN